MSCAGSMEIPAALLRLDVVLLSGRAVALAARDSVTVGELRQLAEKQLALGIAQLLHQVPWGTCHWGPWKYGKGGVGSDAERTWEVHWWFGV